jgi:hypothetical protein
MNPVQTCLLYPHHALVVGKANKVLTDNVYTVTSGRKSMIPLLRQQGGKCAFAARLSALPAKLSFLEQISKTIDCSVLKNQVFWHLR